MIPDREKYRKVAFTLLEFSAALVVISFLTTYTTDAAFTLVEICIVLVVITLMGSLVLGKMAQDTRAVKSYKLQNRIDKIEQALRSFAIANKRLPEPADGSQPRDTSSTFGAEVTNPTIFFTNAKGTADVGKTMYVGVVPVRALASYGLTDTDILDEYNDELAYVVSASAASALGLVTYTPSQLGVIKVKQASGAYRTTSAIELVFSYGLSGHCAYMINGVRKVAKISNLDALTNRHCDINGNPVAADAFVFTLHTTDQTTVNNPATKFDDAGRFRPPEFFMLGNSAVSPDSPPGRIADHRPESGGDGFLDGIPSPTPSPGPSPSPSPPPPTPTSPTPAPTPESSAPTPTPPTPSPPPESSAPTPAPTPPDSAPDTSPPPTPTPDVAPDSAPDTSPPPTPTPPDSAPDTSPSPPPTPTPPDSAPDTSPSPPPTPTPPDSAPDTSAPTPS